MEDAAKSLKWFREKLPEWRCEQVLQTLQLIGICILGFMSGGVVTGIIHYIANGNGNHQQEVRTTFWTDENIAYWANFEPTTSNEKEFTEQCQMEEVFLKQIAKLHQGKCVPMAGVYRVESLILERVMNPLHLFEVAPPPPPSLLSLLVPNQKVVLNRCMPDRSYCDVDKAACKPNKRTRKWISAIFKLNETFHLTKKEEEEEEEKKEKQTPNAEELTNMAINGTLDQTRYIIFNFSVEEHADCSCQCNWHRN